MAGIISKLKCADYGRDNEIELFGRTHLEGTVHRDGIYSMLKCAQCGKYI